MWIIHIKSPVGRYFKVVDTYIKPPMDLPVYKKDRLKQLEQSLKAQKVEYEVETVKAQAKQATKQTKTATTKDKVSVSDTVTVKTQTKTESKESQTASKQETQKVDTKQTKDNK